MADGARKEVVRDERAAVAIPVFIHDLHLGRTGDDALLPADGKAAFGARLLPLLPHEHGVDEFKKIIRIIMTDLPAFR